MQVISLDEAEPVAAEKPQKEAANTDQNGGEKNESLAEQMESLNFSD